MQLPQPRPVIGSLFPEHPLTEELRLQIFGSPDFTVFLSTLLSDGDSRLTRENLFKFGGSREILFEKCGDSRENLFKFLAVVII